MNNRIGLIWTLCSVLAIAGAGEAYAAAGQFQFVAGEVKVLNRAGVERMARKGMDVNEGDTVTTTADASAQIRMVDGGLMAVRPDSRLKVEMFVFNGKQDGQERSLILLLKGGFRAITGLIGNLNKQNYQIRTPTATIGIRGTDHEPMFIPQPLPGVAAIGVPGTYDKVNLGAAFIKTDLGIIHINPNQVGFVAGADKIPQLLPKIPEFYKPVPEKIPPVERSDVNKLKNKDLKSENLRDEKNLKGGRPALEGRAAPTATLTAPATTLKSAPLTSTTTLIAPTTLLISPTTTLIAPITTTTTTSTTTLIAPTTSTKTLIEPTTTLIAPTTTTTSTTTLIAPTTSTTTLTAPTTLLIAPTTTLIAPTTSTTTLIAPTTTTTSTTTLTAPTTTLIAPTTTTIKLAP